MKFHGTSGNDTRTGTADDDVFNMGQGGEDKVTGAGGKDTFNFTAAFDAGDSINGGGGFDTLNLNGPVSVVFTSTTLRNVERIHVAAGHNYTFTTVDATIASGANLRIDGGDLLAGDSLRVFGQAETNGSFTVTGGAGDDILDTGKGNDVFFIRTGGTDNVAGGDGDDIANFGTTLTGADTVIGGAGSDRVNITGDYTGANALVMQQNHMTGVEKLWLGAGFNYDITTLGQGTSSFTFTIDGTHLASANTLTVDASLQTVTPIVIEGGAGADVFKFGNAYQSSDKVDGGAGNDTLRLDGDYTAHQAIFNAGSLLNVETISLAAGHDYNMTIASGNLASGQTLTVDAHALGSGDDALVVATNAAAGHLVITTGAGNDHVEDSAAANVITTGTGDDIVDPNGGADIIRTNGGADRIEYLGTAKLTSDVSIDGGTGSDTLSLQGDYSGGLTLLGTTLKDINIFVVGGDFSYKITMADGNLAAGDHFQFDASYTSNTDMVNFNDSAESSAAITVFGGTGNDTIVTGAGDDNIEGYLGADTISARGGNNTYRYISAQDSTGPAYDTIQGFDATKSKFDVTGTITGVDDTIAGGSLSTMNFDSKLAQLVNAAHMAASHAVVLSVTGGDLAGHTFLVIDQNGTAGYQAGADLVIALSNSSHLDTLAAANFF